MGPPRVAQSKGLQSGRQNEEYLERNFTLKHTNISTQKQWNNELFIKSVYSELEYTFYLFYFLTLASNENLKLSKGTLVLTGGSSL